MELRGLRLTDKQLFTFVVVPLFLLFARYGLRCMIRGKGQLLPVTLTPGDPDGFMRKVRQRHFRETGWPP
jgi:hypothetical protein